VARRTRYVDAQLTRQLSVCLKSTQAVPTRSPKTVSIPILASVHPRNATCKFWVDYTGTFTASAKFLTLRPSGDDAKARFRLCTSHGRILPGPEPVFLTGPNRHPKYPHPDELRSKSAGWTASSRRAHEWVLHRSPDLVSAEKAATLIVTIVSTPSNSITRVHKKLSPARRRDAAQAISFRRCVYGLTRQICTPMAFDDLIRHASPSVACASAALTGCDHRPAVTQDPNTWRSLAKDYSSAVTVCLDLDSHRGRRAYIQEDAPMSSAT